MTYGFAHFRFSRDAVFAVDRKRAAYEAAVALWRGANEALVVGTTASKAEKATVNNMNHAALTYRATTLLFSWEGATAKFRKEVHRVLDFECSGDRPASSTARYSRDTSGRLDDLRRRKLYRLCVFF